MAEVISSVPVSVPEVVVQKPKRGRPRKSEGERIDKSTYWKIYFEKQKQKVGRVVCDVCKGVYTFSNKAEHLRTKKHYICENLLKEKEGKFDIIIDDGPHTWASQEWFFMYYYSLLNEGGVLVCEDIFEGHQTNLAKLKQDYGLYVLDLRINNNPNRDEIMALRFK